MKNATRVKFALMGLAAALAWPVGAGAQVSSCCGGSSSTPVSTSYVATSYALPVSRTVMRPVVVETPIVAQPTAYVIESRRGLFGPRYRETAYYAPTSYEVLTPTVETTTFTPTAYTTYLPTTITLDAEVVPTRYLQPTSYVVDPCGTAAPTATAITTAAPSNQATGSAQGTVASPPRNVQSRSTGQATGPAAGSKGAGELVEPPYEFGNPAADKPDASGLSPIDDTTGRASFKPKATELTRQAASAGMGTLRGEVVSAGEGKSLPNVRLVFSDARNTFKDRERLTDASGRFEVLLPTGDWNVNVVEPDGKLTPFGTITSTSGRFFDQLDRAVTSVRINL